MQIVSIEAGDSLDFDRVATALSAALSARGSVATVTERDGDLSVDGSMTTWRFKVNGDGGPTVDEIIDRLTNEGYDYTLLDRVLVGGEPHVAVGTNPIQGSVATLEPADLDDSARLAGIGEELDRLEPYETLISLVHQIQAHPDSPKAGAIATFTGRVRAENYEDTRTTHLEYEKYEDVADAELEAIRQELTDREGVYEVLLYHHTGTVPAEEDAVYVVVLAGHRREAFRAVEDGIDLLKDRVPIFKKEVTESGEHWAHDRP